jgi:predicted nucleic acid-binding protein
VTFYFDTSALVKLFHEEEGSQTVTRIINSNDNEIWISELARIESMKDYWNDEG